LDEKAVSLLKNIAANFAGNICQALMGLAFIPLYIKFMAVDLILDSPGGYGVFLELYEIMQKNKSSSPAR
jgi:hypothetical protein